MSSVIDLRRKLAGIQKIEKMTEAMQVVAAAQLKQLQSRQRSAQYYHQHYERLAKKMKLNILPTATKTKPAVLALVFAAERGFCGNFNDRLIKILKNFIKGQNSQGREVSVVMVGSRGANLYRESNLPPLYKQINNAEKIGFDKIASLSLEAWQLYRQGEFENVCLFYNRFISMLNQSPGMLRFIPFDFSEEKGDFFLLFEPSLAEVREQVIINYLKSIMYNIFLQTRLGEVAARLINMRSATENTKEMLNDLAIRLNKARQATITIELSEILSSFEVLGGEA